ncbi:MAG: response regulator [Planctomycetes bacterium]|nr:response regulator [Planctomycetota bacterium]
MESSTSEIVPRARFDTTTVEPAVPAFAVATAPLLDTPVWPFATAAAVLVAGSLWWRARQQTRQIEDLLAERRELEALAAAREKELERVSAALQREITRLGSTLAAERRLFDAGPVTMFRWRAASGWPVDYVSPNVTQLFGWSADEFVHGRVRYADVVHPEDLQRVAREVAEHTAAGRAYFEQDYRILHKDGGVRWLYDITLIERDAGGAITHFTGYVLDRTERVQAENERRTFEQRLQQTQRLESLGVLAGGVAHDFNNLLVGILGNAGLARGRIAPDDPNREFIDSIEEAARRAAELTHQMLAYAGRASVKFEVVDLDAAIAELAGLLRASISKKTTFTVRAAATPPRVLGDRVQLDQVVMNLVTNAADALGDRGGEILLATGTAELGRDALERLHGASGVEPGRFAYVEVTDDGCGMDAETQARMFEPFFTTKFPGRGLGLAAVLGIARGHHGGLEVESRVDGGTRVRFYAPLARADAPPKSAAAPTIDAGRALRTTTVLVVDDEPAVQKLAARVMQSRGLAVLLAGDGEQALAAFDAHAGEVGCVLLDLTMPKLSGADTFRALRARAPNLPVIVTSGYSESDATEQIGSRTATYFLQKPFGPDELVGLLAQALDGA